MVVAAAHASHVVLLGEPDRAAHPHRVSGVEPAGDIGGAYVLDDLLVKAQLVHAEALAHVAVDVNPLSRAHRAYRHPRAFSQCSIIRATTMACQQDCDPVEVS